jgi:hypothetical protein
VNRDDLLELMIRECDLCIHLHGKVPEGAMEFRFTEGQRSTAELLRYLSFVGLGASRSMAEDDWDVYHGMEKEAASLDPAAFPAAMERQKVGLRAFFAELPEEKLASARLTMPWGVEMPLGRALLALPYASLVAYRMQLFLHAKAAGNAAIGTANCWGGMDMPEEPAE